MTPEPWKAELERARQSLRFPRPCRCLAAERESLPECRSGLCADAVESIARALAEVRAEERENAAKLCTKRADNFNSEETPDFRDGEYLTARELAAAIRRGDRVNG